MPRGSSFEKLDNDNDDELLDEGLDGKELESEAPEESDSSENEEENY